MRRPWEPEGTAPKDGRLLVLMVATRGPEHDEKPTEDARIWRTIGSNNDDNVGEGEGVGWQFAGWCWSHDHWVEGKGEVCGWMELEDVPTCLLIE